MEETQGKSRGSRESRTYAMDMVVLARELAAAAQLHGFELQVGIHAGSAAGAVIGKLRAFYCIYGDTVNTASRLCKYADAGQIHCSKGFVECLDAERVRCRHMCCERDLEEALKETRFVSRGLTLLKGFQNSIETFCAPCVLADKLSAASLELGQGELVWPEHSSHQQRLFNVDAFSSGGESRDKSAHLVLEREAESGEGEPVLTEHKSFNVDAFSSSVGGRGMLARRRRSSVRSNLSGAMTSVAGSSIEDTAESLSQYSDLSPESKALLNDKKMAMSQRLAMVSCFDDTSTEEQYQEEEAGKLRCRVGASLALHVSGILFQYLLLVDPPHALHFDLLGSELGAAHANGSTMLLCNLVVHCALSVAIGYALLRRPARWSEWLGFVVGLMRLLWLGVSSMVCQLWPMKQYVLTFAALYSLSQFLVLSQPLRHFLVLYVLSHLCYLVIYQQSRDFIAGAFVIRFMCTALGVWMFNVWCEDLKRRRWRLHHVFQIEMKRFMDILDDLVPLNIEASHGHAARLSNKTPEGEESPRRTGRYQASLDTLKGIATLSTCAQRRALVLQFDVSGFTEFSQQVTAMELAQVTHHLFSTFDSTVKSLRLFKMDTVGDGKLIELVPGTRASCACMRAWGGGKGVVWM